MTPESWMFVQISSQFDPSAVALAAGQSNWRACLHHPAHVPSAVGCGVGGAKGEHVPANARLAHSARCLIGPQVVVPLIQYVHDDVTAGRSFGRGHRAQQYEESNCNETCVA